ncbi:MAG TPA: serine/threonine-protein kinase [Polyangiales bacterium]|nr:serine/threonine-protein kinase [Polyangiales bacterium]
MSTATSLIGTTIAGRYRIEARVGSGAMGAVYRAEQAGLGRRVALKIVNRDRQVDGDTIARFRREATALSALHHPNTVRVFDFGTTNSGLLFLAMELLEGEPLTDRLLREGPLPLPVALAITQQVLRSIGEAHARGIVHRDLKPDNIYLARVTGEPAPIVKVLDFGIAKAVAGDRTIDQFETLDGTVFGTPRYMSPEQAGGRALDPRSDLYSVGIMLYELIAGHPPFVDSDAVVVMARHIRDKPESLSRAAPLRKIPPNLDAVVSRSLAKQADERFQSADEFERALDECAREVLMQSRSRTPSWLHPTRLIAAAAVLGVAITGTYALSRENTVQDASPLTAAPAFAKVDQLSPEDSQEPGRRQAPAPEQVNAVADPDSPPSERSVVSLRSAPPAAAVLQDGSELGTTPLDVSMSKGSTLTLSLKKKGFVEETLELRAEDGSRVVTLRRLRERRSTLGSRRTRERARSVGANLPTSEPPQAPSPEKSSPYERF